MFFCLRSLFLGLALVSLSSLGQSASDSVDAAMASDADNKAKILVLGDSLSAEYGIARGSGWVPLLQKQLSAANSPWQVVNASISGDTSSGGRARVEALLTTHQPKLLILELGANDGLRGLSLSSMQANLSAIVQAAQEQGAKVLILGVQIPPNYGPDYTKNFAKVFQDLAKKYSTALVPFFLEGLFNADGSAKPGSFQNDQLHPTAAAQPILLKSIWQELAPLLQTTQ